MINQLKNYKTKDIIVNFIYANHAISILDALVFSGKSSKTSLTYDYNPRLNFHQALISIKL